MPKKTFLFPILKSRHSIKERLNLSENDDAWGIASIGLKFWDSQFGKNLIWEMENESFKELYYELVAQIKKEN